jgi:GNAT superfamily N-acetyltransferase
MTGKNKLIVRKFREADLCAVKSLIHKTIVACYPGHYGPEAVRFFADYHNEQAILHDAREGDTIVFEKAGRIVGTGTLAGNEIKRVFVDPACQRQGVGRLIMELLEDAAAASGAAAVTLDASLPSRSFYDRLGYTLVEKAWLDVESGGRLAFFRMQKTVYVPID